MTTFNTLKKKYFQQINLVFATSHGDSTDNLLKRLIFSQTAEVYFCFTKESSHAMDPSWEWIPSKFSVTTMLLFIVCRLPSLKRADGRWWWPATGLAQRTVWQFDTLNELGVAEEDPELLRAPGRSFFVFFAWFCIYLVFRWYWGITTSWDCFFSSEWLCEWLLEPTNLRRPPYRKCEILFEFWDSGTTWWHGLLLKGLWYKYGE